MTTDISTVYSKCRQMLVETRGSSSPATTKSYIHSERLASIAVLGRAPPPCCSLVPSDLAAPTPAVSPPGPPGLPIRARYSVAGVDTSARPAPPCPAESVGSLSTSRPNDVKQQGRRGAGGRGGGSATRPGGRRGRNHRRGAEQAGRARDSLIHPHLSFTDTHAHSHTVYTLIHTRSLAQTHPFSLSLSLPTTRARGAQAMTAPCPSGP